MAVYERTYHPYTGPVTESRDRFLVLPKYAFKDVFKSKLFIVFLVACYIVPLVITVWIYGTNNTKVIEYAQSLFGEGFSLQFPPQYYRTWFMIPQSLLSFLMALILGPTLVSRDLRNNALPLYLSRPFTRGEYIIGKGSVLAIMISAITWIPGMLLFFLQSYLQGWGWFTANLRVGMAIFLGSWLLILMLTTISLALSAYLRWKMLAQASFFLLFIVVGAMAGIINLLFNTDWGSVFDLNTMFVHVVAGMFGASIDSPVPLAIAWISVLGYAAFFVALLWRKVKAYEVVS